MENSPYNTFRKLSRELKLPEREIKLKRGRPKKVSHREKMAAKFNHIQRVRAIQFMKEKALGGLTIPEIATKYNVSPRTVDRALTFAEKANIFVDIEDQLLREIAPLAVEAIRHALEEDHDPTTALEVLKGLNIIKKNHAVTSKDVKEQDDLAIYIQQVRERAGELANTVEGNLLGSQPATSQPLQLVSRLDSDQPPDSQASHPGAIKPGLHRADELSAKPEACGSENRLPPSVSGTEAAPIAPEAPDGREEL